jgi:hypothetical protein
MRARKEAGESRPSSLSHPDKESVMGNKVTPDLENNGQNIPPPPLDEENGLATTSDGSGTGNGHANAAAANGGQPPGSNGADQEPYIPPPDLDDIDELFIRTGADDLLTSTVLSQIPVGKPKDFFRTVPDPAYRQKTEIFVLKVENQIDEQTFIIGPKLRGQMEGAQPCWLVTVVDRMGNPRLWAVKLPKEEDGKDCAAWSTSRAAVKTGLTKWVRIAWVNNSTGFKEYQAQKGYAGEPDFSKLPPFKDLVRAGFGKNGVIRDETHEVYRNRMGLPALGEADDDETDPFA